MIRRFAVAGCGAVLLCAAVPAPVQSPGTALLDRMAALNPNLRAFTATMHAHVAMKSFPFLSADLVGTYFFKAPDRNKVVFSSGVPVVASQFDKLYAHVEPPASWRKLYDVELVRDNGTTATFHLTPRKPGNVEHIDVTADDRTATVSAMRWNYQNGGYAEMNDRYANQGGNLLVVAQTGHVSEPGYVADVTSTIDAYKINPTIPDAVFTSQ